MQENQQIYWKVERDYKDVIARRRLYCRNCVNFDDNPYLRCAIAPIQVGILDENNTGKFFER